MKKTILMLALLLPIIASAQNIRIQQMRSTGEPAGRIIQTDGNGSFEFTTLKADTMYIVSDTLYIAFGDSILGVDLSQVTESDPIYSASSWFGTTNNASNWDAAYGWGDHSGLYVPLARTITINGTTYDLSANRSWTIGEPSFGTTTQIPFMNSADDDFLYSSDFIFDSPNSIFRLGDAASTNYTSFDFNNGQIFHYTPMYTKDQYPIAIRSETYNSTGYLYLLTGNGMLGLAKGAADYPVGFPVGIGFLRAGDDGKIYYKGSAAGTEYDLTNGVGAITEETDPIFGAHIVSNVDDGTGFLKKTLGGVWSWDNSTYLTAETDPVFSAWDKHTDIWINESQISDFGNYLEYTNNVEGQVAVFNADGKAQGYTGLTYSDATGVTASNSFQFTLLKNSDGTNIAAGVSGTDYFHVENQLHLNPYTTLSVGSIGRDNSAFYVNIGGTIKQLLTEGDALSSESDPTYSAWDKSTGIDITASQVSDFDTEVANNSAVTANTAKVTNATHTGEVTGSTALTIATDAVDDTKIDWGTGTNQVSTTDVPEGSNLYYTEARVSANTAVAANTAKTSNVTHTGEVTGSDALTIASGVVDMDNVADELKGSVTDNDGAFDWMAGGQINCSISSATTFSFSNIATNKNLKIKLVISSSATVTWNSTPLDIRGDAISGDGTYLINIEAWGTTETDLAVTVRAL